jgi:hypothetical protein
MPLLDADDLYFLGLPVMLRCVRCGSDFDAGDNDDGDANFDITHRLWLNHIFKGRPKPIFESFCTPCAKTVTPLVVQLRDIDETILYVRKLERVIHEAKRTKNNGPAENDASQRG